MNSQARHEQILRYAKTLLGPAAAEGFEAMRAPLARTLLSDQDDEIADHVRHGRPIDDPEHDVRLEAIIFPKLRPVFEIREDIYPENLPAPWQTLNPDAKRTQLKKVIRAIGRVNILNHPRLDYGGTGFLIGKNLLLTNRHVAAIFSSGVGAARNLSLTFRSAIDLKQEAGSETSVTLNVVKTSLIHPHWDAAILTVTGVPPDLEPLTLASESPNDERLIAVVGYPAFDPRNNPEVQRDVFHNIFEKKRLQPGYWKAPRVIESFGHSVEASTHDASTLGGNSGSAVIDVATGQILGLHFAGVYLDTNYAVPGWELARDAKLVDLGVQFAPRPAGAPPLPKPIWLSAWAGLERASPEPPPPPAITAPQDHTATWTIPIQITIRVGSAVPSVTPAPPPPDSPLDQLRQYQARIAEAPGEYYPAAKDARAAAAYYKRVNPSFQALGNLLQKTHTRVMPYQPTMHLYPVVDLHPDGDLVSIYSQKAMDPAELIRTESAFEAVLESMEAVGAEESILEALATNSAEHVVPQSWFQKKQPMRGDLHHLFACEQKCNSFRGNTPYFEFQEEAVMEDCGRNEKNDQKFEPLGGKGAVARATLYFLLRYPGAIAADRLDDRIEILRKWHRENEITVYERHRNREIFLKQGNRNPFIDHPEWADSIDFTQGLG